MKRIFVIFMCLILTGGIALVLLGWFQGLTPFQKNVVRVCSVVWIIISIIFCNMMNHKPYMDFYTNVKLYDSELQH